MISMARTLGVAALAGGLLFTAACGGGSGANAAAPKSTGSNDPQGAFRQCLQQHGVTLPSGRPGGQGQGQGGPPPSGRPTARPSGGFQSMSSQQRQAFQACASLAPGGGRFGGGADQSAFKAFQNCMNQHGVKVANNGFRSLRTTDPKIAKALKTCQPLLPQRGSGTPNPNPAPSS